MKTEPTLRSTKDLKQEAEDIGLMGKEVDEYERKQQTLDREKRAAWRDIQKDKQNVRQKSVPAKIS